MMYPILILLMLYIMFSNPIMEGAKNKSRKKSDNKRDHSQTAPTSSSKPPTSNATKLIMFARKLPFYNYLPSFIRASFEKFIKFIIFF